MRFTLPWLREHLATDASLDQITAKLTMLGLEVEGVESRGADLAAFKVAVVTEVRQHPDAERLSVCRVDAGDQVAEVVCGAPNVHAGMKAVFAAVGTVSRRVARYEEPPISSNWLCFRNASLTVNRSMGSLRSNKSRMAS